MRTPVARSRVSSADGGSDRTRPAARYLLPLILLLAAILRIWGLGFGLPYIVARPDETEVAGPAVGFLSGDLRPPFFEWPTLFTYSVSALYRLYYWVSKPFTHYATLAAFAESRRQSIAPFLYISRGLSALFGVLTVYWVYSLCRKAFDETVAVIAAFFVAVAFLHVRDSHFGVTDVTMTALAVLAVLLVVRWSASERLTDAGLAGLVAGLAGSTKYNGLAASLAFVPAIAASPRRASPKWVLAALTVFGIAVLVGFLGASPYVAIDWPRFLKSITGVETHLETGHGLILGRGWWYYGTALLPAALGWPLFLAGVGGAAVMFARNPRAAATLLIFPVAYYAFAGKGFTVFARYIIPVIPFVCVCAAWLIVELAKAMGMERLCAAAAILVAAPSAWKSIQMDRLLSTPDNRIVVAQTLLNTPPARSFYQSGERYGYIPTVMEGKQVVRSVRFDEASGQFDPGEPELVLVQRSPLVLYSRVPATLERVLQAHYQLEAHLPAGDERPRFYDQQDAFYLPLTNLSGLDRPGPSFDLYRRKIFAP